MMEKNPDYSIDCAHFRTDRNTKKKQGLQYIFKLKPIFGNLLAGRGYIKKKNIVLIFLPLCILSIKYSNSKASKSWVVLTLT